MSRHRIAVDGQSPYQIVIAESPPPGIQYAAAELRRFLRESTGAYLPIMREHRAGPGPALYVGPSARSEKAFGGPLPSNPLSDGVACRSCGDDIVIAGENARGQVYGVYEFLERCLGVRFLAWDCTVVPWHRVLEISPVDWVYRPQFIYRENLYWGARSQTMALRHRLNGPHHACTESVGGKWRIHPYVHSFARLVPPEEHFREHPEYFSLINGQRVGASEDAQLCATHPEVIALVTRRVLEWIDAYPDVKIFDVSQNDGGGPCECASCMAVVEAEGTQHGPILRLVNAVADAVAKDHPDVWIETLAYHYSTDPPRITRPRDNVIIRLCHKGDFFRGFEADDLDSRFADSVSAWPRLAPHVFIWHYATNFGHYLAPNQNLQGLARDLQCYARNGVRGVMVQADYESPGGELAELRQYLATRLLWDPSSDPRALRETFCQGYYGLAAPLVLDYLRALDALAETCPGRSVTMTGAAKWEPRDSVTPEFIRESLALLREARAAASNETERARVDRLLTGPWYMQLRRPDLYGLSPEEGLPLLARMREVLERNNVTRMEESRSRTELSDVPPWLERMERSFLPLPDAVVFDLYDHVDRAEVRGSPEFRAFYLLRGEEVLRTIFQFPPEKGYGEGVFEVVLPALAAGERLVLQFETGFARPTVDGARFAVAVDGQEIWSLEQRELEPVPHAIDLGNWAGRRVRLGLRLDCIGSTANDWGQWVRPRVVRERGTGA